MSLQPDISYLVDSFGRQYPLEANKEFTIGRALGNSLTIEDLRISRTHCRLKEIGGFWSVIDESINGIYVNEKRIVRKQPEVLSNSDLIRLSDELQFRFMEAKAQVATDMEICDAVDQIETELGRNVQTDPNRGCGEQLKKRKSGAGAAAPPADVAKGGDAGSSANHRPACDVESELQCSICTELFVKAQTLNCSHTFCKACIEQWRNKKKFCPICRAAIKTVTPTIILDNLVSTVIQSSSDETKQQRRELEEEREKISAPKQQKPQQGRRGRPRRSTAANGRRAAAVAESVVISSDESMSDDDDPFQLMVFSTDSTDSLDSMDDDFVDLDPDIDDYVPGDPNVYYGGYGTCYSCGARGHWANGCPLR